MGKFSDLSKKSQQVLEDFLIKWQMSYHGYDYCTPYEDMDLDSILISNTTHVGYYAETLLSYAVVIGNDRLVLDLLKNKADPNLCDPWSDKMPLQLAADYGRATVAKLLIKYFADFEDIKINYQLSIYDLKTLLWSYGETYLGREVDFKQVKKIIENERVKEHEYPASAEFLMRYTGCSDSMILNYQASIYDLKTLLKLFEQVCQKIDIKQIKMLIEKEASKNYKRSMVAKFLIEHLESSGDIELSFQALTYYPDNLSWSYPQQSGVNLNQAITPFQKRVIKRLKK